MSCSLLALPAHSRRSLGLAFVPGSSFHAPLFLGPLVPYSFAALSLCQNVGNRTGRGRGLPLVSAICEEPLSSCASSSAGGGATGSGHDRGLLVEHPAHDRDEEEPDARVGRVAVPDKHVYNDSEELVQ